ncbi:hypothetical protein OESDEN_00437 [Oesophagostomum dentatum]|uniref:M02D8-5-like seventh CUB domain-containing protein n=1 Tax=Oesophagostomum dentatum TaxID=61180 RepID=A0A0B1TVV4_OESDE|nr:hypothetical protein OESDEN_00437 [Oesophagostomum dentatum]
MQQYNELLDEIPYPASDGKTVFEECGTKMIISYQSPGGTSNGLYARYSRGSRRCNSAGLVNYSLVHVILLLLALIRRRLW